MGPTESTKLPNMIKSVFKTCVAMGLLFLLFITALLLNTIQLFNFILFAYAFPNFRRIVNHFLQELILSSFIYIFEFHCSVRFRLWFDCPETKRSFEHNRQPFVIVNHSYHLDTMFYWMIAQMLGSLGSIKGFTKSSLRMMPIIGWILWFGDSIFVERNWQQDERNIKRSLNCLKGYTLPYMLMIAPEGTRFTEEKRKKSNQFAEKNNIPINLKHHLLPRVKGIASTLRLMRAGNEANFTVYNGEIVCPSNNIDSFNPTLANFVAGKSFKVDIFIEQIANNHLPKSDANDEDYAKFLYLIFERKDQLVEQHREFNRFANASSMLPKQNGLKQFAKFFLLNIVLSGSLVTYLLYLAMVSHNAILQIGIFGFVISVYVVIFVVFKMTANSDYGKKPQ